LFLSVMLVILHILLQLAILVRVILRTHREPASRIAWVVIVVALPVLGIIGYILFGEVNIGRRRVQRMREVLAALPDVRDVGAKDPPADVPKRHALGI